MTNDERRDLLARAAETAFGARWQSDLARHLGVSIRTAQRWASGSSEVPVGALRDLAIILRKSASDATASADEIERQLKAIDE
ncbi:MULTISPECIES: helix-turn-helix transcriptional regulator [unclassified Aureimonas]|uniref:helix-turn-helix transcriptional regulator n=1 Tax=unclassified Aureimonas TaxID=2615206 RepID=UPI0007009472|nr:MULTISPECIES: helix-turn-helix transcriptional regulator [unclassified Aureimonas]KQT57536.1 hypothetical protein ASG62_09510 [Aureimonas sp. Leaf427]KQT77217.1 hypothetical protein ASG54_13380 [Aureimonas sp. Leaf460]